MFTVVFSDGVDDGLGRDKRVICCSHYNLYHCDNGLVEVSLYKGFSSSDPFVYMIGSDKDETNHIPKYRDLSVKNESGKVVDHIGFLNT